MRCSDRLRIVIEDRRAGESLPPGIEREGRMRVGILGGLIGAALALGILPVQAAWHGYVNTEAGFSFTAPGAVKAEKSGYKSTAEGQRTATIFRSVEDDVEYRVTVVNFFGRKTDEPAIIKEAATQFQAGKKVLA